MGISVLIQSIAKLEQMREQGRLSGRRDEPDRFGRGNRTEKSATPVLFLGNLGFGVR